MRWEEWSWERDKTGEEQGECGKPYWAVLCQHRAGQTQISDHFPFLTFHSIPFQFVPSFNNDVPCHMPGPAEVNTADAFPPFLGPWALGPHPSAGGPRASAWGGIGSDLAPAASPYETANLQGPGPRPALSRPALPTSHTWKGKHCGRGRLARGGRGASQT